MAGRSAELRQRLGGWLAAAVLLAVPAGALLLFGPDLLRPPRADVRLRFPEDVAPPSRFRASPVAPEAARGPQGDPPVRRAFEHELSTWENAGGPVPLQYNRIRSRAGL